MAVTLSTNLPSNIFTCTQNVVHPPPLPYHLLHVDDITIRVRQKTKHACGRAEPCPDRSQRNCWKPMNLQIKQVTVNHHSIYSFLSLLSLGKFNRNRSRELLEMRRTNIHVIIQKWLRTYLRFQMMWKECYRLK